MADHLVRCPTFDRSAQNVELMSRLFHAATAAAVGLTALTAIAMTVPGLAQETPGDGIFEPAIVAAETGMIQTPVESAPSLDSADPVSSDPAPATDSAHASLQSMVAAADHADPDSADLRCIATGVYYESRSESLEGQLAVAHVIINRANSGRFASTPCGVLTQRGQFSFVRGGVLPTPPATQQWRTAVAIARIASAQQWPNAAPGAMFFHASRVSPGWNRPRVARLGNHIFYR